MQEQEFREWTAIEGFGEVKPFKIGANITREAHAHDQTAVIMVVSGELKLVTDQGEGTYGPGDICTMEAGKSHQEIVGEEPAKLLIAWK